MRMRRNVSMLATAIALAGAGLAGCGEEDIDKGVDRATDKGSQIGKEAQDEGGEIKRDVEREVND